MSWHTEWTQEAAQALLRPFPADEIDLREGLAYIDARAVQRRLDEVVGPWGWSFTWEPVEVTAEHVAVKGCIKVLGVQKCDAGEAHAIKNSKIPEELVKFAVTDALKRCGVQFGIGRFLYEMGKSRDGKVSERDLARAAEKTGYLQPGDPEVHSLQCANCACDVDYSYAQSTRRKSGRYLCPGCAGSLEVSNPEPYQCARCSKVVADGKAQASLKLAGEVLCPEHGRAWMEQRQIDQSSRVPEGQLAG